MKENEVSVLDQYDIDIKAPAESGVLFMYYESGTLCAQGAYDFGKNEFRCCTNYMHT